MRLSHAPAHARRAATIGFLLAPAVVFSFSSTNAQDVSPTTGAVTACPPPSVGVREDAGLVELPEISEASGIAASRTNRGVLWLHNDSGGRNVLYAMTTGGRHLGTYLLGGASNRDWEDLAVGPGPDSLRDYLYVGDIGDNSAVHDVKLIYRVPEPEVDSSQLPASVSLDGVDRIALTYADGRFDAETLLLDPLTRDLFIVAKGASPAGIYRVAFPQSTSDTVTADRVGTVAVSTAVAGDVSSSGEEILLKNYTTILYWCRTPGQPLWEALGVPGQAVPYTLEPQGEAVAWGAHAEGYYTVSEEAFGIQSRVYFYPRLTTVVPERDLTPEQGETLDNYPNPFNRHTVIGIRLAGSSRVRLAVHDLLGREVQVLAGGHMTEGRHTVQFDAGGLASGLYVCRLEVFPDDIVSAPQTRTRALLYLK